ncbi:MAG: GGDEF domain-containing protein [Candidatus Cloacimonadaceae bacterium]|jgi:diguanylate cyclase (GGDEF)-like protein|nr:GGDEF domain-containing protein [Candidatus Cloacimonadota bacterium]MCB5258654.1 GGDEF domain-containing protein [Candidatus Cloacimonadota bacterium]MDY0111442.1 GGDEF domain-containing protein [Candidatus Syntrophosphaera sp.]
MANQKVSRLSPADVEQIRNLLSSLLHSSEESQSQDIINQLLPYFTAEISGREPSLARFRHLSATLMEQLIILLQEEKEFKPSKWTDFFEALNYFPFSSESSTPYHIKGKIFNLNAESPDYQLDIFIQLQLSYLLSQLGDSNTAYSLLKSLKQEISLTSPITHLIYHLSLARILILRGKRLEFTDLWLKLISEYYQEDGSDTALQLIVQWLKIIPWGRHSALKMKVLQTYSDDWKYKKNLLSAFILYELVTLDNRLIKPEDKMRYIHILLSLPVSYLSFEQWQYLYFFAGNYYSGVEQNFPKSIRAYHHSTYYLHKSWLSLQNLSQFLREHLSPEQLVQIMPFLEKRVISLADQISLQNSTYVETLHKNYLLINELYHQVEALSITDHLTGLKNRHYLYNNLYHAFQLAARHKVPICFAILDIDHFKRVNDKYGHLAGDYVLQTLANMLLSFFRKSDVIIRYGGEEFLLILFDIQKEKMLELMEEFRAKIENYEFIYQDNQFHITISTGCICNCFACLNDTVLNSYIEQADRALYRAKEMGRNTVFCTE